MTGWLSLKGNSLLGEMAVWFLGASSRCYVSWFLAGISHAWTDLDQLLRSEEEKRTRYHKPPGEKAWCSHEVVLPGKSNLNLINTRSDHQLTEEQTTVELVCSPGGMDATSKVLTVKQFEVNHQISSTNELQGERRKGTLYDKRELKVTHLTVQNLMRS